MTRTPEGMRRPRSRCAQDRAAMINFAAARRSRLSAAYLLLFAQDVEMEQKAVPDAVFGGVKEAAAKAAAADGEGGEPPRKKARG